MAETGQNVSFEIPAFCEMMVQTDGEFVVDIAGRAGALVAFESKIEIGGVGDPVTGANTGVEIIPKICPRRITDKAVTETN